MLLGCLVMEVTTTTTMRVQGAEGMVVELESKPEHERSGMADRGRSLIGRGRC